MLYSTPITVLAICGVANSFLPSTARRAANAVPLFAKADVNPSGGGNLEVPKEEQQLTRQQQQQDRLQAYRAISPFAPMRRWADAFEEMERRMFGDEDFFGGLLTPFAEEGSEGQLTPSSRWALPTMGHLDIAETDKDLNVTVDLPGLKKEDINIELDQGLLTISAERKEEHERKDKSFTRQERSYGIVKRVVRVPDSVDPRQSKVNADFKDGVLHITIEKTRQIGEASPRRIEIQ